MQRELLLRLLRGEKGIPCGEEKAIHPDASFPHPRPPSGAPPVQPAAMVGAQFAHVPSRLAMWPIMSS